MEERHNDLLKLQSNNADEVEQALSSIVDREDRLAIPHMIERLKNTSDANIRNAVTVALS